MCAGFFINSVCVVIRAALCVVSFTAETLQTDTDQLEYQYQVRWRSCSRNTDCSVIPFYLISYGNGSRAIRADLVSSHSKTAESLSSETQHRAVIDRQVGY